MSAFGTTAGSESAVFDGSSFAADVLRGLSRSPKRLPSKYFYDRRGSALFERICETEEYYVTRTEAAIMEENAAQMGQALGPECMLIELGSGNSMKTRLLLDHLPHPVAYVPVDIARDQLLRTAKDLRLAYPHVEVLPACADFTRSIPVPRCRVPVERRAIYFPGSTIGNFHRPQAQRLFAHLRDVCGLKGGLLIGIDLKKDPEVLQRAYNDHAGVTEAFNKNLLFRINCELGANFDLERFEHRAFYNAHRGRVEMHLVSRSPQSTTVLGQPFHFGEGESIRTECSYKYEIGEFSELARASGWDLQSTWTDSRNYFGVLYLTAASDAC